MMSCAAINKPQYAKAGAAKKSFPEEQFALHVRASKLPAPRREYVFHPTRKWRFDFAWPEQLVAVEIEGGLWNNGRHTRAAGYIADLEKYAEALLRGWKVVRVSPCMVKDGTALAYVERLLA